MTKINVKTLLEYIIVFAIGAIVYSICEICWRGFTHWTMTLTGGLCLLCIYITFNKFPDRPLWLQCLEGCLTITAIEFIIGYIVNIQLKWNVWDYTSMPFNVMGQICPLYMAIWYIMSIPAIFICRLLKTKIFRNNIDRGVVFNGSTEKEVQ